MHLHGTCKLSGGYIMCECALIVRPNPKNLEDWQVERVFIDDQDVMVISPKGGVYYERYYTVSTWRKAPSYRNAFKNRDWQFFDSEYDTALTFDWC